MSKKRIICDAEKHYYESLHKDFLWAKMIKHTKPIGILEKTPANKAGKENK